MAKGRLVSTNRFIALNLIAPVAQLVDQPLLAKDVEAPIHLEFALGWQNRELEERCWVETVAGQVAAAGRRSPSIPDEKRPAPAPDGAGPGR